MKEGKLSVVKHNKLKFEFSLFKLNLLFEINSKFKSAFEEIFFKISYKIAAEVVVLPSVKIFTSVILS